MATRILNQVDRLFLSCMLEKMKAQHRSLVWMSEKRAHGYERLSIAFADCTAWASECPNENSAASQSNGWGQKSNWYEAQAINNLLHFPLSLDVNEQRQEAPYHQEKRTRWASHSNKDFSSEIWSQTAQISNMDTSHGWRWWQQFKTTQTWWEREGIFNLNQFWQCERNCS